jgi:hypothetical protein
MYTMRNLLLAGTILVALAAQVARAQTRPPLDNSFLLRLPESVDTTDLSVFYFMTGPFGGYGSFLRAKSKTWDYVIDISHEGKSAETLKAIIYCPGYGIELVEVPSLAQSTSRSAGIALKPLSAVRLTGRVKLPENRRVNDLKMEVVYSAYWSHRFYGITDGPVVVIKVASVRLSKDGTFSIMVPDFAADPSVNSFEDRGALRLMIRESETGNIPYTLEREGQAGHEMEIRIGEGYDGELTLSAIPRVH